MNPYSEFTRSSLSSFCKGKRHTCTCTSIQSLLPYTFDCSIASFFTKEDHKMFSLNLTFIYDMVFMAPRSSVRGQSSSSTASRKLNTTWVCLFENDLWLCQIWTPNFAEHRAINPHHNANQAGAWPTSQNRARDPQTWGHRLVVDGSIGPLPRHVWTNGAICDGVWRSTPICDDISPWICSNHCYVNRHTCSPRWPRSISKHPKTMGSAHTARDFRCTWTTGNLRRIQIARS